MKFSEGCETYFGSKDLYKIFSIKKDGDDKDVCRAYYKLSLVYHPNRVCAEEKAEANDLFKVISKIHEILSDENKRAIYDETGVWNDEEEDEEFEEKNWMEYWRSVYSRVRSVETEFGYKGSDEELEDLRSIYNYFFGDMDEMVQYIPFYSVDDEKRIRGRIIDMIEGETLPVYDIFMNEPQEKRDWRFEREVIQSVAKCSG
jgi:DnaJ family protein C protein 9